MFQFQLWNFSFICVSRSCISFIYLWPAIEPIRFLFFFFGIFHRTQTRFFHCWCCFYANWKVVSIGWAEMLQHDLSLLTFIWLRFEELFKILLLTLFIEKDFISAMNRRWNLWSLNDFKFFHSLHSYDFVPLHFTKYARIASECIIIAIIICLV